MAAMDDTILRKRGTKTAGVAWRRDPLGPPLSHQLCFGPALFAALGGPARGAGPGPARMVPIDLRHVPTAKRPRRGSSPRLLIITAKSKKRPTSASRGPPPWAI